MRLLIADFVRRNRFNPVFFGLMVATMFGATAAGVSPGRAFRVSMGMVFGIGPALVLRYLPRTIWYLPVSKRDIWRAGWLVSTVGATLLATAIKLAAILVPQVRASVSLASVALSSVYDFAYAGVGCGLVVLAIRPQPTNGWRRGVSAVLKGSAEFILPLGMVVAFFGDFMAPHLPTHWTDLTPRSIAVLVAALGVTAATYFYSPMPLTPTNRIQRPARARTGPPRLELGGFSGLPYLLVHESAWTLLIGGSMVIGSILVVFAAAIFLHSPEGIVGFLRALLLRLDGQVTPAPGDGMDSVIPLIGFAVFITSLIARFPTMIRHLRVLPLGAARLNLLLIAWPAVTWLVAWAGLLALHYVVVGDGVTDVSRRRACSV